MMNSLLLIVIISILGSKLKEGESQILNGFEIEQRNFNYHASIFCNCTYKCAGGIVDENHVITAAHCVQHYEEHELFIIAGAKCLRNPEAVMRHVKKIFIPVDYFSVQGRFNDIAVLRLQTPLVLGNNIGIITFPKARASVNDVAICSLSGLEQMNRGPGIHGATLSWVQLMLIPNAVCECMMKFQVHPSLLCATVIEENKVTRGDSGAILVCGGVAVGILKGGKNSTYSFGRINHFEYFIKNKIASP